jgi:hypothetical protein
MGLDEIHNLCLINLPGSYLNIVLKLFNRCLGEKYFPEEWKIAKISMIPKKESGSNDPSKYRPISVTSCLGKLYERCITKRLVDFLDANKLLSKNQSGFRRHRSTIDNLYFITRKVRETFIRGKNMLTIFFDIAKAFDKIRHEGLLFKMSKLYNRMDNSLFGKSKICY